MNSPLRQSLFGDGCGLLVARHPEENRAERLHERPARRVQLHPGDLRARPDPRAELRAHREPAEVLVTAAFAGSNFTLTRVNIHGTVDGGKLGDNDVIQDSYIHDLVVASGSHNDGLQSLGSVGVKIRHNSIVVPPGATSAIILSTNAADQIRNVDIDHNLLGGGAFTVYGGYELGTDDAAKVSGIRITDNEFTTTVYRKSGAFGPLTSTARPAVTVTGNTWADGPDKGRPVS